ncbi:hypothetical protein CfE428DRAFT_3964 [Chthoniobacter flavus Ellin428]|uniref:Uncharacterized protein n=1 Tax=Chthoniobacter flavus Ellin428 TaxID=497964 RepID=B4D4X6_9BACT|nr:hypothetical protein CfE428DRAFT_3964 [Chthoniobacter flavus Ellin428]TCO90966.1 hypothetical protein EV701_109116 [Chthoniobacter flavus]
MCTGQFWLEPGMLLKQFDDFELQWDGTFVVLLRFKVRALRRQLTDP